MSVISVGTTVLRADYAQFSVIDVGGDMPMGFPEWTVDQLVVRNEKPGWCLVITGAYMADVTVTVEVHGAPPEPAPGWQEVAEETMVSATGEVGVAGWAESPPPELPVLTVEPGGEVRFRVHATGRAAGRSYNDTNELAPAGVESYLLQLWAA